MPRNRSSGMRGQWTEEAMTRAVEAVTAEMSVNKASITYALPRRYLKENKGNKAAMGRKLILIKEQELELSRRIVRLADVGYPLTSAVLRRCVYRYTKINNIPNPFREEKEMAGRYWLNGFMQKIPSNPP
ncbi:hypothetical protein NQ314_009831 [Rhamnusium bicolor]|uniref:HTH psq-type domain-containing protein n=1 Tax=Rhamnusium bicolor TaxID=1586634 RepID=A0AAV8XXR3_9CUCU|nr:hypothetical protein NQ314_009831 [Rhamnusium bicolor]